MFLTRVVKKNLSQNSLSVSFTCRSGYHSNNTPVPQHVKRCTRFTKEIWSLTSENVTLMSRSYSQLEFLCLTWKHFTDYTTHKKTNLMMLQRFVFTFSTTLITDEITPNIQCLLLLSVQRHKQIIHMSLLAIQLDSNDSELIFIFKKPFM